MIDLGSTFILLAACFGVWLVLAIMDKMAYRADIASRLRDE